jgi:diacylglycerol kinase family enzyme
MTVPVGKGARVDRPAPVFVVMNARSGNDDKDDVRAALEAVLRRHGRSGDFRVTASPAELGATARAAVDDAVRTGGIIVAVGGDGTLNTVANAVLPSGRPMGVIAQGTFNYFARAHGLPEDAEAAMEVVLTGTAQAVQVGRVNERAFLVNASLGLYPQLLEDREAWKARFGRSRAVALAAGLATLLSAHRQLRLHISHEEGDRDVRTLTLVAGNNALQLEQLGLLTAPPAPPPLEQGPSFDTSGQSEQPPQGERSEGPSIPQGERRGEGPSTLLGSGRLAIITVRPVGSWAMLGLALRGAMGTLGDADAVRVFVSRRVVVRRWQRLLRRTSRVAVDGEVTRMAVPLTIAVSDRPLMLIKAAAPATEPP